LQELVEGAAVLRMLLRAQKHRYQRTQKCYMVGIFDMSQRLGL
jgi:hypothetical protein